LYPGANCIREVRRCSPPANATGCDVEIDDASTKPALPIEGKARRMAPSSSEINSWKSIAICNFSVRYIRVESRDTLKNFYFLSKIRHVQKNYLLIFNFFCIYNDTYESMS